ncbi:MAG: hypothetical protein HFI43_00340 [Lachnospiraceae bacterium]|jgi:hypothetical protein|nr:hypothetical protein [Lachnospiraceae bacterium]
MNINGNEIYIGAYAKRRQKQYQLNQELLSISREKEMENIHQVEIVWKGQ